MPMNCALRVAVWSMVALWVVELSGARGQETVAPPAGQPAAAPALDSSASAQAAMAQPGQRYRRLAPGVLHTIKGEPEWSETVSRHDLVEVLAVSPDLELAKNVVFRREIWHLDFQFKPLRYIWVDVPQPGGKMQRKLVRYLIYSVTNPGKAWSPSKPTAEEPTVKMETVDKPIRFIPEFIFEIPKYGKSYQDKIIPAALAPIRLREDPHRRFYTTVDIAREIKVGETLWGVAMWDDIYPRMDFFSIYVMGLTNAYQWDDEPGKFKAGDPVGTGRIMTRKALKLNFWRPGDEFYEHEDEVRFGAPGKLDYEWVYR